MRRPAGRINGLSRLRRRLGRATFATSSSALCTASVRVFTPSARLTSSASFLSRRIDVRVAAIFTSPLAYIYDTAGIYTMQSGSRARRSATNTQAVRCTDGLCGLKVAATKHVADLVVVVFPPRPIFVAIGVVTLLPLNVVAMRFVFPLHVVRGFARPPGIHLSMHRTADAQNRNQQYRRKQKTT